MTSAANHTFLVHLGNGSQYSAIKGSVQLKSKEMARVILANEDSNKLRIFSVSLEQCIGRFKDLFLNHGIRKPKERCIFIGYYYLLKG